MSHVICADAQFAARFDTAMVSRNRGAGASRTGGMRVQIEVTCRHGNINDYAHEHITAKAEKLLTFFERVTAIQITVDFDNGRAKVEILVDAEHKHNFVAHHVGDDVISACDAAFQKMEQQVKKYKEKIQDHRRDKPLGEAFPGPDQDAAAAES